MIKNGIAIEDTFAEAFGMNATRLIITAINPQWARIAGETMTGFATSVIGCGAEAGIEAELPAAATPDGRPGVSILLFAMSGKELEKQVERRVGQCVLTCPSTACFSGLTSEKPVPLGKNLRYFGDGWQASKRIGGRRYWRVPVMDGEFLCEEFTARTGAVGGGNFLVLGRTLGEVLAACEQAVTAIRRLPNVLLPFPGGIARSGSKVGSKYKALMASTNDAYCPTLRGLVYSPLSADVGAVLEIVINGLTEAAVREATRVGIESICALGAESGVFGISAGNYGGKLGQYHFHLREILG